MDGPAPLSPARLPELLDAVYAAQPEDECDWLEWKSDLDLDSRHGQFVLARCILGFANRDPKTTTHPFGGTAYIVVGAEPGRIQGVTPIDLADLQPRLAHYLGTPTPFWRHHYVHPIENPDRVVLVIEVPGPRAGDIAYPLARDGLAGPGKATVPGGTLFIRRGSRTERANHAEVHMLIARAAQTQAVKLSDLGLRLDVLTDHTPTALNLDDPAIDGWIDRRSLALADPQLDREQREVREDYLREIRPYVPGLMTAAFFLHGYNGLIINLDNPSDENLYDTELRLTLPEGCMVIDPSRTENAVLPTYPAEPWQRMPWGHVGSSGAVSKRHGRVVASPRCVSVGTKASHTEPIGTIPAQGGAHTCTLQLYLPAGLTTLELEVAVRSRSLPGVERWKLTTPVQAIDDQLLDELVNPDPQKPDSPRRFQPSHQHPHG